MVLLCGNSKRQRGRQWREEEEDEEEEEGGRKKRKRREKEKEEEEEEKKEKEEEEKKEEEEWGLRDKSTILSSIPGIHGKVEEESQPHRVVPYLTWILWLMHAPPPNK